MRDDNFGRTMVSTKIETVATTLQAVLMATVALAVAGAAFSLHGQAGSHTCARDCELRLERVVTLGDDEDGIVGTEAVIARSGSHYYVSDHATMASIQVFDAAGRFAGRIGRQGQGPGEYGLIQDLAVDHLGRVWVADMLPRLTVLEVKGADAQVLQVSTIPALRVNRRGLAHVGDGRLLLNAVIHSGQRASAWTHLVTSADPPIRWSLDDGTDSPEPGRAALLHYVPGGPDEYWSIRGQGVYRLERRGLEAGALVSALQPGRHWFDAHQETIRLDRGADPHTGQWIAPARIRDVQARGSHLWVLGTYEIESGPRQVLDVLDLATGRLVHSQHLESARRSYYSGFVDPDLITLYEETDTGTRLHLERTWLEQRGRWP